MSDDDKPKDDKEPRERHHTGSVVAEDDELTLWLNRLWARNEPPERIEVWQMFGRNKATRGEMIHHEDFKFGTKLNVEQANKLANEIMEAAQNDCDAVKRSSSYQIAVIDRNRRASPLTRRLGPLQPRRQYLAKPGEDDGEEDEDSPADGRALALKYVQENFTQVRWDKNRNDRVLGEALGLLVGLITDMRQENSTLRGQLMANFTSMQEAQDRALDRELVREKEKFRMSLLKDGMRTARNLLPGLFAGTGGGGGDEGGGGGGGPSGAQQQMAAGPRNFGSSPERTLVDNFLSDIEDDDELMIKLFGDYEQVDPSTNGGEPLKQLKPGIFTLNQFKVLVSVRKGNLSADALDALMPNSGHALAITQEQVAKAGEAGVTEGIGMALIELLALRNKAREARENGARAE